MLPVDLDGVKIDLVMNKVQVRTAVSAQIAQRRCLRRAGKFYLEVVIFAIEQLIQLLFADYELFRKLPFFFTSTSYGMLIHYQCILFSGFSSIS